jgi:hypothetical protein
MSSQVPALFGSQTLFGATNLYFGDVEPAVILKNMLSAYWTISNPNQASIIFTNRWVDPTLKVRKPFQISCLRSRQQHKVINIGANSKFRIDATVPLHVWTLTGIQLTGQPISPDDVYVLHQNIIDEIRRVIKVYGTSVDKKFLLGDFMPLEHIDVAPFELHSMANCSVIFFRT